MARSRRAQEGTARSCPKGRCDGSGWLVDDEGLALRCECLELRAQRARATGLSSVIPRRYRGVGFDRPPVPDLDRHVVGAVRKFVDELDKNLDAGTGLWFMGDIGTGKTTLAMIVSKAALERGRTVAIYSLPRLLAEIRRTYDHGDGEQSYLTFFERLSAVDLLHIDDLGAERQTEWVLEQLYALVNQRYEAERSLMVTTNLKLAELREQIGLRTVSRLMEMCPEQLMLAGDDRRVELRVAEG